MTMETVLTLSSYLPATRSHGGEIRLAEISDYLCNSEYEVINAGVLSYETDKLPTTFIKKPDFNPVTNIVGNSFLMEDACISLLTSAGHLQAAALQERIKTTPKVIHIEQPWLFELGIRYRDQFSPGSKIVYGSANIEHKLKQSIVEQYFGREHAARCATIVKEIEEDAIRRSDICIAVTEEDKHYILSVDKTKSVYICPNASNAPKPNERGFHRVHQLTKGKKYALFVGSGHPPNVEGFLHFLGGHSAAFSGDVLLVIAGSAGNAIKNNHNYNDKFIFKHKVIFPGFVDQPTLDALIKMAHQILLPIRQGGGSNLKTAEALLSQRSIVASSCAMRGFEKFANEARVTIADTPTIFKRSVAANFLETCMPPIDYKEIGGTECLTWKHSLSPLNKVLKDLTGPSK